MQISAIFQIIKGGQRRTALALALTALIAAGLAPAKAACSPDTLSSLLLSPQVPLTLFVNPNGNPLTTPELDEIQTTILNIRSTLGEISSFVSVKDTMIPRSLDMTVGANVKMSGYSFSPKTFAAQTKKAGNVIVSFAVESRSALCKIFWMRVSMPVSSTNPNNKERDRARNDDVSAVLIS